MHISCTFMRGSYDIGCYIELRMPIGYYTAVYISRSIEEPTVTGCIYRLDQGNYTLDMYKKHFTKMFADVGIESLKLQKQDCRDL